MKKHNENSYDIEQQKYVYDNIIHWIDNVDNKISILLAFSAVCMGFVLTSDFYNMIIKENNNYKYLFYILVMLLCASCICCLMALKGKIKSKYKYVSSIFFGGISNVDRKNFFETIESDSYNFDIDLKNQIYINSCICSSKFKLYNISLNLLLSSVFIIFLILFLLVI